MVVVSRTWEERAVLMVDLPTVDVLPAQGKPDGLEDMVGKDGDEQVPVGAVLFLVVDGT